MIMFRNSVIRVWPKFAFIILLSFSVAPAFAATVDTIDVYSKAMQKNIRCVVIVPESYKNFANNYPVVYLLHGYSGDYANWINKVPELKVYADHFQLMIVCPDGDYSSWYFDSPVNESSKYETYISSEVPAFIDANYHTMADRKFRAISGLSMGGHGALSLAWKHPDLFGAAGSMSGALDLMPFKSKYHLIKILGDTLHNDLYQELSVINLLLKKPNPLPSLIFDCGTNDPFIASNRQLHRELLDAEIPHDYIERGGGHSWDYWRNSIPFQLMFFHLYFKENFKR